MLATKDSNEPTDRSKTISSALLGITIGLINHDKGHIIINCQLDIRPCNKISPYLKTTALLSRKCQRILLVKDTQPAAEPCDL